MIERKTLGPFLLLCGASLFTQGVTYYHRSMSHKQRGSPKETDPGSYHANSPSYRSCDVSVTPTFTGKYLDCLAFWESFQFKLANLKEKYI